MYGVDVSPSLISDVTDGVKEQAGIWQSRPLDSFYAVIFLDALSVKCATKGASRIAPFTWLLVNVRGWPHGLSPGH
jgi:putative transposase